MPVDNITINTSSPQGGLLKQLSLNLQNSVNLSKQILNYLNQQTDGQVFTVIEGQFGLQNGTGQTLYNLIAGLAGEGGSLTESNVVQYLARMN